MCLKDCIPGSIRISSLSGLDEYFDIVNCVDEVVKFVNDNGGWTLWDGTKGESSQILEVPEPNVVSTEVVAGQINYHIVHLLPSNRHLYTLGEDLYIKLKDKKYDIANM